MAACFPPVVPGPRGDVEARAPDGRGPGEEVGGGGEPLVRGGEDARAEWGGNEICNVGGVERLAKVGVWEKKGWGFTDTGGAESAVDEVGGDGVVTGVLNDFGG